MSDAQLRESVLADPRLRPTPLHEKPYLQSRYSFSRTDFDQQRDAVADILDANLAHRGLDNASATTIMTTADFDHKMAQLRAEQAQRASLTPNFIALRDILDAEISSIAVQHAPTLPALPTTQPQSVPTAQPRPPSPPPSLAQAPSVPSFSGILSSPPVSRAALSSPPPTKAGPKATTTTTIADPSAPASPLSQRPPKAARSTVTPQSPTTTTVRPVSPALADDSDDEPDSDDEAFRRHQHQHPSASTSAAPVATHTRSTQPKGPVFSPSGKRLPPGAVSVFPMGAPLVPVSRAPASPPPASNLSSTSDHSDFDDDVVGGTPSGRLSSTPARSRVPRTEPESPGMDPVPHEGASPHDPHARMQAFDAADDDDDDDDEGDDEDDEMEVSERAANETVVIERDANGMPRIAADVHLALTDDDDLSLSDQQVSAVSAPSDDQNSYSQPHPASTTISRPKTSTGRPGSSRSTLSQLARDEQVEDSLKDLLHSGVSDSTAGTLRKPKVVNLDDDDDDWDDDFGDVQVLRL